MSASKERKQELERQRLEEEQKNRKSMRLYALVGGLCAVLAAAVLVLNSGILQRSLDAVTVNGTGYSAADVQYYYNMEYQNAVNLSQTYAAYGMSYGFDPARKADEQIFDEATGQTWEEHFLENAKSALTFLTAACDSAEENGHTMSQEAQTEKQNIQTSLDTVWLGSYPNRDAFIRSVYGSYMTYDRLMELLDMELLASDYVNATIGALEYTDEDYDAYYQEHADELDTFTLTQFTLQAKAPVAAEGEEVLSQEEMDAALEQEKAHKQAVAQELQAKLDAGEDPEALAQEYDDELFSSLISTVRTGSSVATSSYGEWMLEDGRKSGDTDLSEYDGGTVFNYYVVRYEGRELDESKTADIRHALIAAEQDADAAEPNADQYAAALEKAEALLESWEQGEATEESFAQLCMENSADGASAANGGLMEGISAADGYVPTFLDWCMDPARTPGETGIVQNTGSSVKGWHIMYYVADGAPVWVDIADTALRNEDYIAWETAVMEGYEAAEASAMIFV